MFYKKKTKLKCIYIGVFFLVVTNTEMYSPPPVRYALAGGKLRNWNPMHYPYTIILEFNIMVLLLCGLGGSGGLFFWVVIIFRRFFFLLRKNVFVFQWQINTYILLFFFRRLLLFIYDILLIKNCKSFFCA